MLSHSATVGPRNRAERLELGNIHRTQISQRVIVIRQQLIENRSDFRFRVTECEYSSISFCVLHEELIVLLSDMGSSQSKLKASHVTFHLE